MENSKPRLIVGVSGASGTIYAKALLESLQGLSLEIHLVVSDSAREVMRLETDFGFDDLAALATVVHDINDIGASISSGSFKTIGMIIAPCSMKTLAEIANGVSSNLLSRAADVVLKERRKLVLMVRETPFNLIHLRNMVSITEMGGIIAPPLIATYTRPESLDEAIRHSAKRVLDLFDLPLEGIKRWQGDH